jgi:hypothetical protein
MNDDRTFDGKLGIYKRQYKTLPYTIKEIDHPKRIQEWYAEREEASLIRKAAARDRTIEAWTQVDKNVDALKAGTFRRQTYKDLHPAPKVPIFTRIYNNILNFFLNIQY